MTCVLSGVRRVTPPFFGSVSRSGGNARVENILMLQKEWLVVNKPAGVPSQADPTKDTDLLTLTADALRSVGEADTLYPIHRLDRAVGGLLVLARTKAAAAELSSAVVAHRIGKEYLTVVHGALPPEGELFDYLYKDATKGKSFVVRTERRGAKAARLFYRTAASVTNERGTYSLLIVRLDTGRYHQIRAQLSSRGHPIVGDKKYGSRESVPLALFSAHLTFSYAGEGAEFFAFPSRERYPWSLFADRIGEQIFQIEGEG